MKHFALLFFLSLLALPLTSAGCSSSDRSGPGSGGATTGGAPGSGAMVGTGGLPAGGGGAAGGLSGSGATTGTGGVAGSGSGGASGGQGAASGGGGTSAGGGASGTGAAPAGGGSGGSAGAGGSGGEPGLTYALPPPDDCLNRFFIEDGCEPGNAASTCAGQCQPLNACVNEGKTGEPGFICPRYMLFSDIMEQAAKDDAKAAGWSSDGDSPFVYGVVGHDPDTAAGRVDEGLTSGTCCECYQLVPASNEQQAASVPLPKAMVVQSFNTQATTDSFDVYMAVGGLGSYDACSPSGSGLAHMYSGYPMDGQSFGGGIKPIGEFGNGTACKDQYSNVSAATLGSAECQALVSDKCEQISHASVAEITSSARNSCLKANQPESLYHQNMNVLAKRVACPPALTEVTGCKLADAGLPPVDPTITTSAQATNDPGFKSGYHTTSMEDCCKPTCAWQDNVGGRGKTTVDGYDSFYTCFADGVPVTQ